MDFPLSLQIIIFLDIKSALPVEGGGKSLWVWKSLCFNPLRPPLDGGRRGSGNLLLARQRPYLAAESKNTTLNTKSRILTFSLCRPLVTSLRS